MESRRNGPQLSSRHDDDDDDDPGQLNLAIPPWLCAVSTSESWGVNRNTVQCANHPWLKKAKQKLDDKEK